MDQDSNRNSERLQGNLGIVHDAVGLGQHGVTWGFGLARVATNTGFGIASAILNRSASALDSGNGSGSAAEVLRGVDQAVSVAHRATNSGQDLARVITQASLSAAQAGLSVAGAREGELYRRAFGEEAGDAVHSVVGLLARESAPLAQVSPVAVVKALQQWSELQSATAGDAYAHGAEVSLPEHSERWLRFSAATFGATCLGGLVEPVLSAARAVKRARGDAIVAALSAAGIHGNVEIVRLEEARDRLFSPGYLVAVDHETGFVVIALRGTSSAVDVLADLVCEPVPVELAGVEGRAHEGMLRAARRLDQTIIEDVEVALTQLNGPRRVIICGHSLGAGVAALLAALWRDSNKLPGVDLQCMAFACPQILDPALAAALANHTTSVIVGDDMVPRLSAASVVDLREAVLCLIDPRAYGLEPNFREQGYTAAHAAVRRRVCTAEGRLCPAGRLIHLVPGRRPLQCGPESVDELIVSNDMALSHMPKRYLEAIRQTHIDPML